MCTSLIENLGDIAEVEELSKPKFLVVFSVSWGTVVGFLFIKKKKKSHIHFKFKTEYSYRHKYLMH